MIQGPDFRRVGAGVLALVLVGSLSSSAYAIDCNTDIAALAAKRQSFVQKLNDLAKAAKGKLDPVASCPALQGLVKAEGALIKYLDTNGNWCNFPPEQVANLKAGSAKSIEFSHKACQLADQMRKNQQQQAAGNAAILQDAPKLPTGPL